MYGVYGEINTDITLFIGEYFMSQTFSMPEFPQPANPLAKYFRIPGVHVKIPSQGAFMPAGSISFTPAGDIPVYPMAARDELLLKSPDALMSGYALEKLIESCVPAILTPRLITTQDLDVLLLAIRVATYGETMNLDATCPKCESVTQIRCHLPGLLATMKFVDPDNAVRLSDEVMAYVRPYNLVNATTVALASYEEARKLRALDEQEPAATTMVRNTAISQSMDRINNLNLAMLGDCILKIVVPGAEVADHRAIAEFVGNVPKPWIETIDAKLRAINQGSIDKSLHVVCQNEECKHEWDTEVELNPSNFFDADSSK